MATLALIIAAAFLLRISAGDCKPSPYEALKQYNFPPGILPKGSTGFYLNRETSEFSAYFNGSCSFALENAYQLKYKPEIKGLISDGRLQKLSGVSVKVLLFWLNIVEVRRKSDELEFSVGFTSANFPVKNFRESPQCGCGMDCATGNREEIDGWNLSS